MGEVMEIAVEVDQLLALVAFHCTWHFHSGT